MHFGKSVERASYFLKNFKLEFVSSFKDLGILIDEKLDFGKHCSNLYKKCNFICYSITKLFSKRSPKEYFDLFKIYVRPILEYNTSFWFPTLKKYVKIVESVQKRFTKRICPRGLTYSQRLNYLSDLSIQDRSFMFSCHLVYKSLHNLLHSNLVFSPSLSTSTRGNSQKLQLPFVRSSIRKSFCTIRSISDWNSLPVSVVTSPNFHSFKRALVSHTLELRA